MENSWQAIIEKNEDGEFFLPIGADLVRRYGWVVGDDIDFEIRDDHVLLINHTLRAREKDCGLA